MHYSHLMVSFLWGLKVSTDHALISPEKLQLLHEAVLKKCDALDGVKDGLVENPTACHFDPSVLKCRKNQTAGCLTDAEVATANALYKGPRNPRTGKPLYPGYVPGSEAAGRPIAQGLPYGWSLIQGPLATQYAVPLLRNMVFGDKWDWRTFDFDKDVDRLDAAVHDKIDSTNPDLSGFQAHNGKLLMVQGWGDPFNAQTLPIEYRKSVTAYFAKRFGEAKGAAMVDGFFKLFMVPGMGHCLGGPGPSKFDALSALRQWVEDGRAPASLVAEIFMPASNNQALSRPLCPYPQNARWNGTGPLNEAASFSCAPPAKMH
jgi:feruloyl esterase